MTAFGGLVAWQQFPVRFFSTDGRDERPTEDTLRRWLDEAIASRKQSNQAVVHLAYVNLRNDLIALFR